MGFPPSENREDALLAMSVQDPFSVAMRAHEYRRQQEMEEDAGDTIFVILSDVQLDKPMVIK